MTQWKAYLELLKKAKENDMTIGAYCDKCGVSRSVPNYWKKTKGKDVNSETLKKLGIK